MRAAGGETATIPGGRPERTGEPPPAGEPPGETHFPAPLCRPSGPADLPDVPIRPEDFKTPVRGSESKAGISREGPASRRPGIDPRVKRTPPRPCAGLEAPQTSRNVPNHPEGGKKPARGSESKAGISREGPASRRPGMDPRAKHLLRAPCAGPAAPDRPGTSQSTRRAEKRLYAALGAKQEHPRRGRPPARPGGKPAQA